ncbi:MAG: DUF835 domain-containing protein [Candidatus Methanofastidiosia archaeon]
MATTSFKVDEDSLRKKMEDDLESSRVYVLKCEDPGVCYEKFFQLSSSRDGMIISREHPGKIEERYQPKARLFWLSQQESEEAINPTSLHILVHKITTFVQNNKSSVILLDGLEYLFVQNGFERTLKHLHRINDVVMMHDAIVVIPIHPRSLDEKEMSLLENTLF